MKISILAQFCFFATCVKVKESSKDEIMASADEIVAADYGQPATSSVDEIMAFVDSTVFESDLPDEAADVDVDLVSPESHFPPETDPAGFEFPREEAEEEREKGEKKKRCEAVREKDEKKLRAVLRQAEAAGDVELIKSIRLIFPEAHVAVPSLTSSEERKRMLTLKVKVSSEDCAIIRTSLLSPEGIGFGGLRHNLEIDYQSERNSSGDPSTDDIEQCRGRQAYVEFQLRPTPARMLRGLTPTGETLPEDTNKEGGNQIGDSDIQDGAASPSDDSFSENQCLALAKKFYDESLADSPKIDTSAERFVDLAKRLSVLIKEFS